MFALMEGNKLQEISRIVINTIALRIVKRDESHNLEKFEGGQWCQISPLQMHQSSFDKRIREWLDKYEHLLYIKNNQKD